MPNMEQKLEEQQYFSITPKATAARLEVNTEMGLSEEQVRQQIELFGENRLKEKKKPGMLAKFAAQFKDVMILILLAAAAVSFVVALKEGDAKEFFEPILIVLIVMINALMGVIQENKAEKSLEALKGLSAPHARVIRGGTEHVIEAVELVPGDVIHVEAGDYVPADARLVLSAGLKAEESALTGESVPSEKEADAVYAADTPLGDRRNMIFSGSSITYGTATAIVTHTGMRTEMGKIADLLDSEKDEQTPLQKKLAGLGKYLGIAALAACVVVFVIGVISGMELIEIFMIAVSLAVSAIPEGLPAIVTIVLSIGVQRMVKRNAIIRRLPAVETLGSASVICSDKTGTLTQNRMTMTHVYTEASEKITALADINESGAVLSDAERQLLAYGVLCSDGAVNIDENGVEEHIGDPTETAIVLAAHKAGMPKNELNERFVRLAEVPFDSDRKLMSVICEIEGQKTAIVKGAFDMLAARCIAGNLTAAAEAVNGMGEKALRVLGVAYRTFDTLPEEIAPDTVEKNLTFLGLLGMIDPARPEAKAAVAICREAGIRPVMITGDHAVTASAIAKELGIQSGKDLAITGAQLDRMDESQLMDVVEDVSVYARVSPENKIRIVKAWQKHGAVVAMTGDGVNDAPALKAADIGCAMGITGTDVAKSTADMTLTDDNFSTIVAAVKEGRGIYDNIRKTVNFLLGTNIGEILTVFFAMLIWRQSPLASMQLLWINLVTDSLPAIALGVEDTDERIMTRKPRPKDESIFADGLGLRVIWQGAMFAILTLTAFFIGKEMTGGLAGGQTMAFMVLSLTQIIHTFNMRSERSIFETGLFGNRKLNQAVLISAALTVLILFTPLAGIFQLVRLPAALYGIGLLLSFIPVLVMEGYKHGRKKMHHAK